LATLGLRRRRPLVLPRHGDRESLVIEPRQGGVAARARDFWRYKRLIPFFGRRFIEKMYMRTWLGWLWIPLRPVLDVSARVLVFGTFLKAPSNGAPYFLFFILGVSLFRFFASTTQWATRSLELNRRTVQRLYLPRLCILFGALGPSSLFYSLYLLIAVIGFGYYYVVDDHLYLELSLSTLLFPAAILLAAALALSIGLFTSVYGAQARDVRFSLNYVMGFWLFLTPIIYPLSAVPDQYQTAMQLNPMTAPAEMTRLAILGTGDVPLLAVCSSLGVIAIIATFGLRFFAKSEAAAIDNL
jgi:lipopolysaccharide transport system permease protein